MKRAHSSVTLGDSLDLVLLLDGVAVGSCAGALGGGDDLVSEGLGHGLQTAEGGLSGASGHVVDCLVHSSEG